jgi:hypothetical protein
MAEATRGGRRRRRRWEAGSGGPSAPRSVSVERRRLGELPALGAGDDRGEARGEAGRGGPRLEREGEGAVEAPAEVQAGEGVEAGVEGARGVAEGAGLVGEGFRDSRRGEPVEAEGERLLVGILEVERVDGGDVVEGARVGERGGLFPGEGGEGGPGGRSGRGEEPRW